MNKKSVLCVSVLTALAGIYGVAQAATGQVYNSSKDFVGQVFEGKSAPTGSTEYYAPVFYLKATPSNHSTVVWNITNSTFTGNSAGFVGDPANANAINWSQGGAIVVGGGTTTIDGSTFSNNSAGQGGAISQFHHKQNGKNLTDALILKNSTFTQNQANAGGAMSIMRDVTITNTQFNNNTVIGDTDGGGALFIGAESNVLITDSVFDGNKSKTSTGGAIATRQGDLGNNKDAKLEIINTVFKNNTALGEYQTSLTDSQKNTYVGRGGAIQNSFYSSKSDPARVTITSSTFENNQAVYGGAILNEYKGAVAEQANKFAAISIKDSTFTGNSATEEGGAIYNTTGSELRFYGNNTFSGNTAKGQANDIHNDGEITVVNGTLTLDGGITGKGTISLSDGSALSVKVGSSQEQSTTITNSVTVGQNVSLNLTFTPGYDGVYKLADTVNGAFTLPAENALFDINAVEGQNGSFAVAKKSANEIAQSTGANSNQASALEAIIAKDASTSKNETFTTITTTITENIQSSDPVVKQAALDAVTALSADAAPVVHQVQSDVGTRVFSAVGTRMSGGVQGMASGDVLSESALWVQTMAGRTDMDDTATAKGYDADSYGFAMGAEGKLLDTTKVGVGFAYNNTDVDGFLRTTEVDGYTAFVYGEYKPSNWFVNGIMSYTWSDYEETKSVVGTNVVAKYDVNTFGLQAMTGYDFVYSKFAVTPEAGLRYFHISQDSYTDDAGTKVNSNNESVLTGVLGARIGTVYTATPTVTVRPEFRLAMTYDLADADNNSFVTLANGASYTVEGESLDRFGVETGLSATVEVGDNVEFSLSYEGTFRGDYQNHIGLINAKYKF